jgi:hypothetical protein
MKNQNKILSIVLIVVLLIIAGFALRLFSKPQQNTIQKITPSVTVSRVTVYQSIQTDPKTASKFDKIDVEKGTTELAVLKRTSLVETKGEGQNAFVISINGRKVDDAKHEFWAFYVNGKQAEIGAGSYILQNNDKVLWKIENY